MLLIKCCLKFTNKIVLRSLNKFFLRESEIYNSKRHWMKFMITSPCFATKLWRLKHGLIRYLMFNNFICLALEFSPSTCTIKSNSKLKISNTSPTMDSKTFLLFSLISSLNLIHKSVAQCPSLSPVKTFNTTAFAGWWYEIKRYKTILDAFGGSCASFNLTTNTSNNVTIFNVNVSSKAAKIDVATQSRK